QSVSPGLTMYVDSLLAGASAFSASSASSGLTVSTSPGKIISLESSLSAFRSATDVPTSLAIPHQVSPLDIVYSSAETAVAATPVIAVKVATDTTVFFIK